MKNILNIIFIMLIPFAVLADTPPPGTVKAKLQDGAGTPITSSLVTGKQGIDVNVINSTSGTSTVDQGNSGVQSWLVNVTNASIPVTQLSPPWAISAAALPLPTGASTSANQATEISSLSSIDSKLTPPLAITGSITATNSANGNPGSAAPAQATQVGGSDGTNLRALKVSATGVLSVDGSAVTQPISASSLPLPTGAATSALQISGNSSLTSIDSKLTSPLTVTGPLTDTQLRATPVPVSGTVAATQSGTWNVTNISGTVSLPTGAATAANQATANGSLSSIDSKLTSPLSVAQSGVWTVGATISNFPATQAVTQSGAWTVGRTWNLTNGSDSVASVQSGTWNLTNISGTISLPTGAATSANQTNGTQKTQVVDGSGTVQGPMQTITGTNYAPVVLAASGTTGSAVPARTVQIGGSDGTNLQNIQTDTTGKVIVGPKDVSPATQNLTTQDVGSTTTAMANGQNFITGTPTAGSAASFAVANIEAVEIQVTGTWTGTLQTEVSMDGGTTWFTRGVKQTGSAYLASSFTANFEGGMNFAGMTNVRVRSVAALPGTATVKIVAANSLASIVISNPLTLRDATTQSISNTIKAASTAATTTDTAMVVALSPNSLTPAEVGHTTVQLVRNAYSTTNVTTAAYVQLIASTADTTNQLYIFDSSGQTLFLAVGGAGSEVNKAYIVPGGNGILNLTIPAASRVSVKAVSGTASAGELNITLLK